MCQLVLPGMRRARSGRIVNVSSMGGRLTFPGGGVYHAIKHAVEALSDAMRYEVRGFGVDVVVIEPGLIRTRFGDVAAASIEAGETGPDDPYRDLNAAVAAATPGVYEGPLARLGGGPEAVARAIERAAGAPAADPLQGHAVRPPGADPAAADERPRLDAVMRSQFPAPGPG
jgi:NAD(P)-dependent dehydrogenase (short-subunit alcohol dehydrogenase family)